MNVHSSALHSSFFEWENKWMKENDIKLSWSLLFRERRLWREELPDTQDTVLVILVHVCSPHINQFCVSPLRSPSHSPQGKDFYRMPWPSVPKGHLGTCWWTEILVKTIEVRDSAIWGGFEEWKSWLMCSRVVLRSHALSSAKNSTEKKTKPSYGFHRDTCSKGVQQWAGCSPQAFPWCPWENSELGT